MPKVNIDILFLEKGKQPVPATLNGNWNQVNITPSNLKDAVEGETMSERISAFRELFFKKTNIRLGMPSAYERGKGDDAVVLAYQFRRDTSVEIEL